MLQPGPVVIVAHKDVPSLSVAVTSTAPVCVPAWPKGRSWVTLPATEAAVVLL